MLRECFGGDRWVDGRCHVATVRRGSDTSVEPYDGGVTTARNLADPGHGSGWHFRLFGFEVSVPLNALIGIVVIALLWYPEFAGSTTRIGQWVLAAVFALLLMVSILIHEFAHAYAARAFSYPVSGITLWAMGGFTSYRTTTKHGPLREGIIALAGPAATLAIAVAAWFLAGVMPAGVAFDLVSAVASANFLVGFFNLLPGSPLDGGAVVKAIVWGITGSAITGQVVAGWVGRGLAIVVLLSPFVLAWQVGGTPSLVLIVVAVLLATLLWTGASSGLKAAQASRTLDAITAGDLAYDVVPIAPGTTVAVALPQIRPDAHLVVVDPAGRPYAVVNEAAARAVPDAEQGRVTVVAVSASLAADAPVLPASAPATAVVTACQDTGSRFVFVAEPGSPTRIIDTDAAFVTEGP